MGFVDTEDSPSIYHVLISKMYFFLESSKVNYKLFSPLSSLASWINTIRRTDIPELYSGYLKSYDYLTECLANIIGKDFFLGKTASHSCQMH